MKRSIAFALVAMIIAAILIPGSVLASDADAVFSIGYAEGKPGETVEISVALKANSEINSIAFHDIEYDSKNLEFVGFSNYEHLNAKTVMPIENFVDAEKLAILVPLKTSEKFEGELCKLRFRIKENAINGDCLINASSVVKNDSEKGVSIVKSGSVKVSGGIEPDNDTSEDDEKTSGSVSGSSGNSSSGNISGTGGGRVPTQSENTDVQVPVVSIPEQTENEAPRFIDLDNHSWASDAINSLADDGIIKGTSENTFSPSANITRADFAILLVRAFKLTSNNAENFADVKPADYFAKELAVARNTGLVNGIGDNKFAPRSNITRQDMMVIVYRALTGMDKINVGDGVLNVPQASDFDKVADYAREAVSALINAKLINGKNGLIDPRANTTRAEVAVLIERIVDYSTK